MTGPGWPDNMADVAAEGHTGTSVPMGLTISAEVEVIRADQNDKEQ